MDCSFVSSAGYREFTINSSYYFRYCLSDQVFDVGGAPVSAAKVDSSSPELVREATSSSASLVEILTTLLEVALALPLEEGCESHPLLALNNVRVDPQCFPSRSRHLNEVFSFWL